VNHLPERSVKQNIFVYSIVVPVYQSADGLPSLFAALDVMRDRLGNLEIIFIDDGSTDGSLQLLHAYQENHQDDSRVVSLSRNFGAVRASRVGVSMANGYAIVIMAADLQDPPEAIEALLESVTDGPNPIAIAVRRSRTDPFQQRVLASIAWSIIRRTSQRPIPQGGFDTYAIRYDVRDAIIGLGESEFSPIEQLMWIGYPHSIVLYDRAERQSGKSQWSFKKRVRYFVDNASALYEYLLIAMIAVGLVSFFLCVILAAAIVVSRLIGNSTPAGYSITLVAILGGIGLQQMSIAVVGIAVRRTQQSSSRRPVAIIASDTNRRSES
jgi:glycosyltransferase involved in cell wall biosynthesis